jgi:two-component system, OmpR family, sensor histidine kinase KdpD
MQAIHDIPVPAVEVRSGLTSGRRRVGWLLVVLALPAFTALLLPLRGDVSLSIVLLLYLLAVVVVAVVGGMGAGVAGAVTSFLLANFVLTEPYYTLRVAVVERVVELVVFVVVAVLVSLTVDVGARHRANAERNRLEALAQAARVLQYAETDRVRATILAAVSHDLRTPLAGIKAAVSGLRQEDVAWTPEEEAELLGSIEESSDRLTVLVTNLLALSRIRAGALSVQPEPVGVDEVVGSALLGLGQSAASVVVDVPEDLPAVHADPDLLERVVANLAANAVHVDAAAAVRARVDGERVLLEVVDHGPGVPEERWEEMFQPFHRLDGGTSDSGGVGLAIVDGFCSAMGIDVTPSATPGGGLTMRLALEVACPAS